MPFAEYPYMRADIVWGDPTNPATYPAGRFDVVYDNNGKDLDTCKPLIDHFKVGQGHKMGAGAQGIKRFPFGQGAHVQGGCMVQAAAARLDGALPEEC